MIDSNLFDLRRYYLHKTTLNGVDFFTLRYFSKRKVVRKLSYAEKAELLFSEEYKNYKHYKRLQFKLDSYSRKERKQRLKEYENIDSFFELLDIDLLKQFERLSNAHYHRVARLKKRIKYMLELSPCLFLTLTFNNDTLNNTSDITRRSYVVDFLKQFNVLYIANQDFGKKKGREHYHAVLGIESIDYHLWIDKFHSRIDGIKIDYTDLSIEKVSKYIAKLTNHAIKNTNKRSVIIYSRGFPKNL